MLNPSIYDELSDKLWSELIQDFELFLSDVSKELLNRLTGVPVPHKEILFSSILLSCLSGLTAKIICVEDNDGVKARLDDYCSLVNMFIPHFRIALQEYAKELEKSS